MGTPELLYMGTLFLDGASSHDVSCDLSTSLVDAGEAPLLL